MCGVIGGALNRHPLAGSIPRVRGYRRVVHGYPLAGSIPRMRGLSEVFDLIQKGTDVFPACGVIIEKQKPPRQGIPRVRGYRLPMGKNLHL